VLRGCLLRKVGLYVQMVGINHCKESRRVAEREIDMIHGLLHLLRGLFVRESVLCSDWEGEVRVNTVWSLCRMIGLGMSRKKVDERDE